MPRHRILWVISLLVVTIFSFPNLSYSEQERWTALVIGNGSYKTAPLRNPANDARDMAKVLEELGFEVIWKVNAGRQEMDAAVEKFYRNLNDARVGFFYYAGHGMQVDGSNYLLPVDIQVKSSADIKYRAVKADWILAKMEDSGSEVNIVVLDACRDNPFRGLRGSSSGLAPIQSLRGSFIAYATSPGSVARDGEGRNGMYTTHLLKNIKRSGLTVEEVFREVRKGVAQNTNYEQIPWDSSSLMGAFYMAGTGSEGTDTERRRFEQEQARLEKERLEFEQAKAEFEQQKRESTRKKVEVASIPQKPSSTRPSSTSSETKRDGIYVAYANGIVKDTKTGLEWKVGPDKDTNWDEARSWVQSLNLDGGGWRMPTTVELNDLYNLGAGDRNMTPLLKTSGWYVWSGETEGSSYARSFYFHSGSGYWGFSNSSDNARAFAVRSQKESQSQKIEVASLQQKPSYSQPSSTSDIVNRDVIYVAYANGIVKDTETGLEWKVGPDTDTSGDEARSWVENLNLDAGGWRMPTTDELKSLYKKGAGDRNMTSLLKTTGWWVWSGETKGSGARCFDFDRSGTRYWNRRLTSYDLRAFAVRSQKESQSQKIEVASLQQKPSYSQPSSTSDVLQRDGIYVAYANGIVKDTNTDLEWKVGPDENTDWNEARSWVQSLNLDGGGWRMPTVDELEGLYKKGMGSLNITFLLKTTSPYLWVWSGETQGSSLARGFSFGYGDRDWYYRNNSDGRRAFAVRSRSDG